MSDQAPPSSVPPPDGDKDGDTLAMAVEILMLREYRRQGRVPPQTAGSRAGAGAASSPLPGSSFSAGATSNTPTRGASRGGTPSTLTTPRTPGASPFQAIKMPVSYSIQLKDGEGYVKVPHPAHGYKKVYFPVAPSVRASTREIVDRKYVAEKDILVAQPVLSWIEAHCVLLVAVPAELKVCVAVTEAKSNEIFVCVTDGKITFYLEVTIQHGQADPIFLFGHYYDLNRLGDTYQLRTSPN